LAADFARSNGVVPLGHNAEVAEVAAVNPFKIELVAELGFLLGRPVQLVVADPGQIQSLLLRHYGGVPERAERPNDAQGIQQDELVLSETDLAKLAGQPPIIRFVNVVLAQAIRDRASDIHFEPFEQEFRIRCRIDGMLHDAPPPPRALALPVVSRLKVLANLNIAERRLPQDGRMRMTVADSAVDLRVSTLPTQFGESVVLRVLDRGAVRLEMKQLGLPAAMQTSLTAAIHRPHGLVVVTGPTGSGKTTTLYSCLQVLNTPEAKLLTVEDPVEYEIDGIMQVPVNPAAGLTFPRALRSFLRQDPDIVMVGEIRDEETARIAIQSSLTGHLVLSTLHTSDAASVVTRLVDMGIEPFLLASTLEAVLAQRLLRRICTACRTTYAPSDAVLRQLNWSRDDWGGASCHRGSGCAECQHTGYRGRIGIFEYLSMSESLRDLITRGASLEEIRREALRGGMVLLRDASIAAIQTGQTTVEEVLKAT
ncbi:MAG TPA: GspE/PulE family protein, partial [Bacteroidia bacterium]|nr:GspE/PulE family protein [Bacteroidia bacterium]